VAVRRLQLMSGMSVCARLKTQEAITGWSLSKLATHYAPGLRDDRVARAIRQAITQVEEVRAKQH